MTGCLVAWCAVVLGDGVRVIVLWMRFLGGKDGFRVCEVSIDCTTFMTGCLNSYISMMRL